MPDPSPLAVGAWSGGRFMHFGRPVDDDTLISLLTPDQKISTVLTADVYGCGEADISVGKALQDRPRDSYCLVGAIGHDFYDGQRQGAKGFPRFTDPTLRKASEYRDYVREATEKSLQRIGVDSFDLLLLHNPDRIGYTSQEVWDALVAVRDDGLTKKLGVAPGPANGFTLDLIDCFERFSSVIDWAMIILGPLEPWPGEFVLQAADTHNIKIITRVVDYGGLLWDDVLPDHEFAQYDHRKFRPNGWIQKGREKIEQLRPLAESHNLTLMQLACSWCLHQPAVASVVPTIIQELGSGTREILDKRLELANTPVSERFISSDELNAIRLIGDNSGSMRLKGANATFDAKTDEYRPDMWHLSPDLLSVAARWEIDPFADLCEITAAAISSNT